MPNHRGCGLLCEEHRIKHLLRIAARAIVASGDLRECRGSLFKNAEFLIGFHRVAGSGKDMNPMA